MPKLGIEKTPQWETSWFVPFLWYSRGIKPGRKRWAGHLSRMEESRKSALKILTGKPTEKRALGKPRCGWEDNITMNLKN